MTIEVREATPEEQEQWNQFVASSPQGTIYHRKEFLDVVEKHSGATLHLLIGYKSEEPRGIFPVFEQSKGPLRLVFSPPPQLAIPYLGPALLNFKKMKQRKVDLSNKEFIEECLDWIRQTIDPHYTRVVTSWRYNDPRPFLWSEYTVTPQYTYRLSPSDEEQLMRHITRSARRSITRNEEADYSVERDDKDGLAFIINEVKARYEEQGDVFRPPVTYFHELEEALPAESMRSYVAYVNERPVLGRTVLQHDGCASFWQGMTNSSKRSGNIPIGDLLNWETMTKAIDFGATEMDLIGANSPRLCRYKAKFNPDIEEYYILEQSSPMVGSLVELYKWWNG